MCQRNKHSSKRIIYGRVLWYFWLADSKYKYPKTQKEISIQEKFWKLIRKEENTFSKENAYLKKGGIVEKYDYPSVY